MSIDFPSFISEKIRLELSGGHFLHGILIDKGSDILVVYDGKQYLYIPDFHVQSLSFHQIEEVEIDRPNESPILEQSEAISLRKVLYNAKGMFTEIFVTGQSLHGYITSIMNNYFVFYSPVYKTMCIPLQHLKWLTPYNEGQNPYGLSQQDLPLRPTNLTVARTFEEQLKKFTGKMVVFDTGKSRNKIGKLQTIDHNLVELVLANNETICLNLHHVKTVHFPNLQ
ncbi:MAG TPA: DUF2642 domain-containing protein [Bacillales bacterium]|nr:DUF2642 domain-containing protein [Bacillales bacterium]